jgi:hypothetical protein
MPLTESNLLNSEINKLVSEGYVFASTFENTWGLIIPEETGVIWTHQVDGICCHHVFVEGVFLPLRDLAYMKTHKVPNSKSPFHKERRSLLHDLAELNYHHKDTSDAWNEIREKSGIDFRFIDVAPEPPENVEGLQWVVVTEEVSENSGNILKLGKYVGKPIIMVYPNSD